MLEDGGVAASVGADVLGVEAEVLEEPAQGDVVGAEQAHVNHPRGHAEVGINRRMH